LIQVKAADPIDRALSVDPVAVALEADRGST
jgi:hypothetical protein